MNAETFAKYERQIQATQARRVVQLKAGVPSAVALFNYAAKVR